MELNEIHSEHEHATTSLKVILLVFAIVLVGALAYLVWAQNTASDTTDNSAAVTKKKTAIDTANWKVCKPVEANSSSLKYPTNAVCNVGSTNAYDGLEYNISGIVDSQGILVPGNTGFSISVYTNRWGVSLPLDNSEPTPKKMVITNFADLVTWSKSVKDYPSNFEATYAQAKVNGNDAVIANIIGPNITIWRDYYIAASNRFYRMDARTNTSPNETLEAIINTFNETK